jgi:hypothetical protein
MVSMVFKAKDYGELFGASLNREPREIISLSEMVSDQKTTLRLTTLPMIYTPVPLVAKLEGPSL